VPSHPDRVRRNYIDIEICKWKSILDYEDHIMIKVTTSEIASLMSRKEAARYICKKIYDEFSKPKKI